jgi:hypothetical protein
MEVTTASLLAQSTNPLSYIPWLLPLVVIGIIATFIWNSVISVAVYKMSKTDRNIESLQRNLHETTEKLVDERLRRVTHEVNGHVQGLVLVIEELKQKLAGGDASFNNLVIADHSLEKELIRSVNQLKEYVHTNAADKKAFEIFCGETRKGREELLKAIGSLERQVVTSEDLKRIIQEIRRNG